MANLTRYLIAANNPSALSDSFPRRWGKVRIGGDTCAAHEDRPYSNSPPSRGRESEREEQDSLHYALVSVWLIVRKTALRSHRESFSSALP
jgi:hypothetical protein